MIIQSYSSVFNSTNASTTQIHSIEIRVVFIMKKKQNEPT